MRAAGAVPGAQSGAAEPRAGDSVVERYTLVLRIGAGAQGEVWTAHDRLLGERVALKWLLGGRGGAGARARREIAVLRMLRVPGVVQLIDEGVSGERTFVVMEHVAGEPFPGLHAGERAASWSALEHTTLALLETLGRVHAAGVVHRDLKPANVLVRADGLPVVLDFGISHWCEADANGRAEGAIGTPAYMAPEQIEGGAVDPRTDLYAVGAMLFEALAGELPHAARDLAALLRARRSEAPAALASLAKSTPAHVASAIDRLLAPRPADRFPSASDAIAALRGAPARTGGRRGGKGPAVLGEAALRRLFAGPDRLFHLREDAARVLLERTSGIPARVEAELDSWERLGLARRDGTAIVIDPSSIARLRALRPAGSDSPALAETAPSLPEVDRTAAHRAIAHTMEAGQEGRLFHLVAAGDLRAATVEALAAGRARASRGDLAGATAAVLEGLAAHAHGAGAPRALELALLSELSKIALVEATSATLDRALYELSRAEARSPEVDELDALVRAALAAPGPGGLEKTEALTRFTDPMLERQRHRVRVIAAAARSSTALLEDALREVRAWAAERPHPMAALAVAEGTALLRYAEGRFEEAARLHLEAARLDPWLTGRLAATSNAASALLEDFRHREAAKHARAARKLAAAQRIPYGEGRAEWLLRSARYRAGEALVPDTELLAAVARLGVPSLHALVAFTEAAIAFRAGQSTLAAELAEGAARIWKQLDRKAGTLLAKSLAIAAGAPCEKGALAALRDEAAACPVPGIGLQSLGLTCLGSPASRRRLRPTLERLAEVVAPEHRSRRMDVLSAREAVTGTLEAGPSGRAP